MPPSAPFKPPRTFDEALAAIATFRTGDAPFRDGSADALVRLEGAFARRFPEPLRRYVAAHAPARELVMERVGNPVLFWPAAELTASPLGYRVNPSGATLEAWSPGWFLFADEGADPIIVDLDGATDASCPVLQAAHGMGEWSFAPVADSIPQYLLLSTAMHHALTMVPDPFVDDEHGFRLVEPAAEWLVPRLRGWGAPYAHEWTSALGA